METRAYMFGTAKKRSTSLESKGIEFPREDMNAPRMLILKKECPDDFTTYVECLAQNQEDPSVCKNIRQDLFDCGRVGFKKYNTDPDYDY